MPTLPIVSAVLLNTGTVFTTGAATTVIVKSCVTVSVPSLTVRETLFAPTSLALGVPLNTPVVALKVSQLGSVTDANTKLSPASASVAVRV